MGEVITSIDFGGKSNRFEGNRLPASASSGISTGYGDGGGGGGGDGIRERLAVLENQVAHVEGELARVNSHMKWLFGGGVAAIVLLFGALTGGYFKVVERVDKAAEKTEAVESKLMPISLAIQRISDSLPVKASEPLNKADPATSLPAHKKP